MDNHKLTIIPPVYYRAQNPLLVGEFQTSKGKLRVMHGYNDHIFIANKNKLIFLTFETRFKVLREAAPDPKTVGKALGIMLEREGIQHFVCLLSGDVDLLRRWREYFSQRINQRCFHESFKAHKKIGKGNFASVYLADRLEDQCSFAVKAFSKEVAYGQDKGKESLKNEIQIMRQLDSGSLIKLHEVYETDNSLYMVMDLLEGGSLYEKIKNRPQFTSSEVELMMKLLLEGLHAMHSKRIMHRDLKPENILFRKQNTPGSVCIADFGLATNADEAQYLFSRCGTPGFVAPEVVNCKEANCHYEPVCDVFSLGLIFYILLTGKPAFPGKSYNDVLAKNRKCEILFEGMLFENVPQNAYDLLRRMLERDPNKRISALDALKHYYFGKKLTIEVPMKNNKHAEEQLKFDLARIRQEQNSPLNSPIIAASSRFKNQMVEDGFTIHSPIITGTTDSVQGSPTMNSPRVLAKVEQIQCRPSRFKDGSTEGGSNSGQGTPVMLRNNDTNPLHKYAIKNEMQKKQQVKTIKEQLSTNL